MSVTATENRELAGVGLTPLLGDALIVCEICGSPENPRMAPVMTGVPFSAPKEKQRFVCGDCFYVWHEYGATTAEKIVEIRSGAPTADKMLKPIAVSCGSLS